MSREDGQQQTALTWIVALPLLGDRDLAVLIDLGEQDARRIREGLVQRGWVEWVAARSGGPDARPLMLVRDQALPALADWLGVPLVDLAERVPVGRAPALAHIARVDAVQGVNRMLAGLARDLRAAGGNLVRAGSLPLRVAAHERWWPMGVQAFAEIEVDDQRGFCFVAWDRAGAPDVTRRGRVRTWFADGGLEREDDASEGPILVVCAGDRERQVWKRALLDRMENDKRDRPDVLLTTATEVFETGALHARWMVPGFDDRGHLAEWMPWRTVQTEPLSGTGRPSLPPPLPMIESTAPTLRSQLRACLSVPHKRSPMRERVAGLALELEPQGRMILEWVARHTWLTVRQLAVLLDDPEIAVTRHLSVLAGYGAVRSVRAAIEPDDLWIATRLGLRSLAGAEQVPLALYERLGAVDAPRDADGSDSEVVLPRIFEHELGINASIVLLAQQARRSGGRLSLWRNGAESTHIFSAEGQRSWIRPDGSGVLELHGPDTPFLLEYDRGTLGRDELSAKLRAYERYYATEAWTEHFDREPVLFFVCADHRAAVRIDEISADRRASIPLLVTWGGARRGDTLAHDLARAGDLTVTPAAVKAGQPGTGGP